MMRKVKKVVNALDAVDGDGVKLKRIFGPHDVEDFDPFLMMDVFDSTDYKNFTKGFPWHPHRGIETVTYVLEGSIKHGDSLGNSGMINSGECQWMTAGSGILHEEIPQRGPRLAGAQIWINLSAKNKMVNPKYRGVKENDIMIVKEGKAEVRVLAGEYNGVKGAISGDYVDTLYLDVILKEHTHWEVELASDETTFIYLFDGTVEIGDQVIEKGQTVLFDEGAKIMITTNNHAHFILLSAKPLREPVVFGGPIVMNTKDELSTAFLELETGDFIK